MLFSAWKLRTSYFILIVGILSSVAALAVSPAPQVAKTSGDQQTGTVGTTLSVPFVVTVTNADGTPEAGVQVDWAALTGGSFKVASILSDSKGLATNILTLGSIAGFDKVSATIHSTQRMVYFGATAKAGPPQTIAPYSGNGQTGPVGTALPISLAVICNDQYGNAASQTEVDWIVGSGGGSVSSAHSFTEAGIASEVLTLGTTAGADTVTATVHGTTLSYTFSAQAIAGPVATLAIVSGNNQMGNPGKALPIGLNVIPEDSYGNPKRGVHISWVANNPGDSFNTAVTAADQYGHSGNTFKLGSTFGAHTATVSVVGTNISQTFTATEGANVIVTMQDNPNPNPQALQPYFLGLSYGKDWIAEPLWNVQNQPLVTLFKNLGPGVLRVVAEKPINPVIWNHNGRGQQYGVVSQADLARLAGFVKAVNWKVLYGIALVGNKATCEPGQTACAADEAAVAAQEFGSNLMGFEIGNEPDVYNQALYGTPEVPQIPGYTFQDYISTTPVYASNGTLLPSWPAFASAIQAAVPNAVFTGPTGGIDWFVPFAESDQAPRISLLTRHFYGSPNNPSPTMADLLVPDPRIPVQFPEMLQAAQAAHIPGGYRLAECNIFSGVIPGVTNGFGASLWTIDFLFANAFYQSTGVNFHGGASNLNTYSPLHDNGTNIIGIGPDYYGLFAYSLLVKGGTLLTTQITPPPAAFSAYAVQQPDGSTDVILSNKDPINSLVVGVERPGATAQATSLLLTAPSLTATTGFQLGGSPINIDGSWDPVSNPAVPIVENSAVVTVPAGSAQIIHLQ